MKNSKKLLALALTVASATTLAGCGNGKTSTISPGDYDPNATYTYNDYLAGSPKTFNVHTWEENADSYIIGYTEMPLYNFELNKAGNGYDIVPEMAAEDPVDVTSQYVGQFGVNSGDTRKAFKIKLNEKATWENGTKINADTYIYSMQKLLDPKMQNRRADSYYSGDLEIVGARNYFKSEAPIYTDVVSDAGVVDITGKSLYFSSTATCVFFGGNMATYYKHASYNSYFTTTAANATANFPEGTDLYAYLEKNNPANPFGMQVANDKAIEALKIIAKAFGDSNPEAYKEFLFYANGVGTKTDWSNVGLLKTGEYEITVVTARPITKFNLYYNLSSNWIVYKDLYESNMTTTNGFSKTTYGTTKETYMSYGPYKLTQYQKDKQINLEKNKAWYGYTDGKHVGDYWTTNIHTEIVPIQATALSMFKQGKLDNVALATADMTTYRTSDYILYTPQSYTTKISFNTSFASLESRQKAGVNKTIVTNKKFRQAFSYALDRASFATQCTASHVAGYGLQNYMYVADPDTGLLYRESEQGQKALKDLYGVSDVDDITGFDLNKAKGLFVEAYNEHLAAGHIKSNDKIEIEFTFYNSDVTYDTMLAFFNETVKNATAGTVLEGRVSFTKKIDDDYYKSMQMGDLDVIFSTWGGSSMNPFSIMEIYTEADPVVNRHEYGYDVFQELTININGQNITKTLNAWGIALNGEEYGAADVNTRLTIQGALEYKILSDYATIPLYYRTTASLNSMKVNNGTDTYVQIVAFGGIAKTTYNYTDAQWDEYVKSQNSNLPY